MRARPEVEEGTRQLWFLGILTFGWLALVAGTLFQVMYVIVALPVLWWLRPIRW